jgi:ABC-2 type transport system permease protein
MNRMALLIRREFWEHRAFLIAPAIVAGIMVLMALVGGNDFSDIDLDDAHEGKLKLPRVQGAIVAGVLGGFSVPFLLVMSIVAFFYLLDSLYGDRKDRSVYFWKSLPVSDTETVLSKLITAVVVIPLLAFAAAFLTTLIVAFIGSIRLSGIRGFNAWSTIWNPHTWATVYGLLFYSVIACMLWTVPVSAWLMLVSAWARRAVILWAVLPPLILIWCEYQLLRTNHIAHLIGNRFEGWVGVAFHAGALDKSRIVIDHKDSIPWPDRAVDLINPGGFLASPGLWAGLAVAALFVWGAIQIRRRRMEA